MGVYLEGVVLRVRALPPLPQVNGAFYETRAAANTSNASLNEAAGKYLGNADLSRKRDSLYSPYQLEQLQAYLAARLQPALLRGIVYISGGFSLTDGQDLQIADGALITESAVFLSQGASLTIKHTATTRTLPGLVLLNNGGLIVTENARLRVHGLVYSARTVSIEEGAHVDVVGSVLGNDPGLSVRNSAGTVVIRYDPAVLGTPGLRVAGDTPVVAWVTAWEELP